MLASFISETIFVAWGELFSTADSDILTGYIPMETVGYPTAHLVSRIIVVNSFRASHCNA